MKKTTKALLAAFAISSSTLAFAATTLDRVIAIVNDDVIMESQLKDRLQQIYAQYPPEQLPPKQDLEAQLLNRLVEETLELELARRAGISISEQELGQTIARVAAQNGVTVAEFEARLVQSGESLYAAREKIRRELILNQVQQGAVGARIKISEQEIRNYLASDEGKQQTATAYKVAHILIPIPADSTSDQLEEINEQAKKVFDAADAGEDFGTLARTYSKAPDALEGGQLGWRKIQELPTLFANHIESMSSNEVSPPFRSGAGYHIVKLEAKQGAEDQVIQQTEVRHILISPNAIRSEEEARELLIEVSERYVSGEESFEDLAKEYSEDYGSARKGGSLGWSNPGSFVPQFEQTMNTLDVGEISDPVRSQFGWHVIEVTGRRDQNMSERYLEMQAENFLRSRKFYDELPRWRQELRDDAFIEVKAPYNETL